MKLSIVTKMPFSGCASGLCEIALMPRTSAMTHSSGPTSTCVATIWSGVFRLGCSRSRPIFAATNSAIVAITRPQSNLRRSEGEPTRRDWLLSKIDKRGFAGLLPSCRTVIEHLLCFGSTTNSPIKRYRTSFRFLKERSKRAFIEGKPCLKICLRKERDPA